MDALMDAPSTCEAAAPALAPEMDGEMLQQLQQWPMNRKTLEAERDFLKSYAAAFGFGRDQRRLHTLEYFLEKDAET